ncbi:hypothetical protein OG528_31395 [Streptomyces platensis]|uniref:hypothetical protein n=1 Tax=Streptomyces platensis TaxID=58346 RepID=UPI0030DF6FF2
MTTTPASGPRPFTVPTAKHRTRFFDYRIPSLYAGRYEIHDRQILRDVDGGDRVIGATPQPFDVIEPRFSIDPGGINARFPAPDAVGTYSQILPRINLDAPGLPWNRPLGPEYPKPVPPEPGDPHPEPVKAVPWMALLLFREDELPEDPDAVGSVTAGTVRELLCSRLGPGHPPALPSESLREEEYEQRHPRRQRDSRWHSGRRRSCAVRDRPVQHAAHEEELPEGNNQARRRQQMDHDRRQGWLPCGRGRESPVVH